MIGKLKKCWSQLQSDGVVDTINSNCRVSGLLEQTVAAKRRIRRFSNGHFFSRRWLIGAVRPFLRTSTLGTFTKHASDDDAKLSAVRDTKDMNQLVHSLQAHRDDWVRYFTFSLLVFLAILLSPAAAQKFQLLNFLFLIVLPSCFVAIPFIWEFFFGVNAAPKRRIGIMGISFCLLLNQAIGANRLPESNHTSMTILQCLCFGLALNIGIWMNNPMDRSGGSAAS